VDRGKLRVGILFGGRSTEHEVSISSATTIFHGLDAERYTPVLIGSAHDGTWLVAEPEQDLEPGSLFQTAGSARTRSFPSLRDGLDFLRAGDGKSALSAPLDVVFPIIHGREGEDGCLQGVLEMARVPYVGAGVMASALCMDKSLTKRVLRDAGLPVVPAVETASAEVLERPDAFAAHAERQFGFPLFVKPTNTGSSVGVTKAHDRGELEVALKQAARFDFDVLVEPGAGDVREIECAVLGGHDPLPSVLGEIVPDREFYDYDSKYKSEATQLIIPARLPQAVTDQIRALSVAAFRATKCWGMARVDFFVERGTDRVVLNELNTLPGFTSVSMYPLLWQATGLELPALIDRLLELALERDHERRALIVRYQP
jgi:D-alanine-D-alanine ligase